MNLHQLSPVGKPRSAGLPDGHVAQRVPLRIHGYQGISVRDGSRDPLEGQRSDETLGAVAEVQGGVPENGGGSVSCGPQREKVLCGLFRGYGTCPYGL